jgi:hypothetical protein
MDRVYPSLETEIAGEAAREPPQRRTDSARRFDAKWMKNARFKNRSFVPRKENWLSDLKSGNLPF